MGFWTKFEAALDVFNAYAHRVGFGVFASNIWFVALALSTASLIYVSIMTPFALYPLGLFWVQHGVLIAVTLYIRKTSRG